MIIRVEYQSADAKRSAIVLRLGERNWTVVRQWVTRSGRQMGIGPIPFKSLTSAQSNARTWCEA